MWKGPDEAESAPAAPPVPATEPATESEPPYATTGPWMQDIGSGLQNVSKGSKKGVSQEHANQLAVTNAGYKYTRNMHLGIPPV